ncbi:MAG: Lysine exporter protein [Streptosporangiaceae bacterium]|jgi:threonine/homoserine/homoserine lactone efflux protein|nr:Lysine exporter protein [Streptosporangiaceae bacterium]
MPVLLVPFLGVVAVLTVTPGPDMLLVLRNGLRGGSRTAWFTGLGCCAGISVHATAAVLGLSAVLAASATAYSVVKLAGAAYLAYLGVRMLLSALRPAPRDAEPQQAGPQATAPQVAGLQVPGPQDAGPCAGPRPPGSPAAGLRAARPDAVRDAASAGVLGRGAAFRQGLFTNLLNPKIALLFLTLLPQFVGSGEPRLRTTAVLAAVFLVLAVVWWRLFTLALSPVSRLLRTPRVRRTLDGVAGTVMLAIGAKVALEPR